MIHDIIHTIITGTLESFDIAFCVSANIATYLIIKSIEDITHHTTLSIWSKRIVFIIVSLVIAVIYCIAGTDYRTILNSIILAPVSWSWVFKPICAKLNIDYTHKD